MIDKEFLYYSALVRNLSEKTIRREFLDNHHLRSSDYHVDHMLSIKEGFNQSVPPEILSDIANLKIIPKSENLSKGSNSSITFSELLEIIAEREYEFED